MFGDVVVFWGWWGQVGFSLGECCLLLFFGFYRFFFFPTVFFFAMLGDLYILGLTYLGRLRK